MPRIAVVLPAAGRSTRFGESERRKPFVDLRGRPVWQRALEPFVRHPDVSRAVVCVSEDDRDWFSDEFAAVIAAWRLDVVIGGAERAETVLCGLEAIGRDAEFVAVHDAARPLVTESLLSATFAAAIEHGAAIPGTPVASTVKRVADGVVVDTVDRSYLALAQTPQVFRTSLLRDAYRAGDRSATDEAQLVERFGHPVHVVPGDVSNFKITTREDLLLAEAVLDRRRFDGGNDG